MLRTTQLDGAVMIKLEPTTGASRHFDLLEDCGWIREFYSDDFQAPFVDLVNDSAVTTTPLDSPLLSPTHPQGFVNDAVDAFILQSLLCDEEPVFPSPMTSPVVKSEFFRVHPHPPKIKPAKLTQSAPLVARVATPRPPAPKMTCPPAPVVRDASASQLSSQTTPSVAPAPYPRVMLCGTAGCAEFAVERNRCQRHANNRKCVYPACTRNAQSIGLCIRHGGGRRCEIPGCPRGAQARGKCKTHGGGVRCKVPGCARSSQGGHLCRTHGGGKLCNYPGCKKGVQRHGMCSAHGGSRRCNIPGCGKADRGGGVCTRHKLEAAAGNE